MMKEAKKYEFIGLEIEVTDSSNKALIGLKGTIVDETKNTFKILTQDNKEKIVVKDQIIFITKINEKKLKINGKILSGRPEERIKK